MINEENLYKLYSEYIKSSELKTKELNLKCGFSTYDILQLIENKIIERVKRGYYKVVTLEELFNYGKHLVTQKEYEKAKLCFIKCLEIDKEHVGSIYSLLFTYLKERNYEKSLELLETIRDFKSTFYRNDYNYFILLLNEFVDLPSEYQERIKKLTINDIKVLQNDKRYKNIPLHNKIRVAVLEKKLIYAWGLLYDLLKSQDKNTLSELIEQILLYRASKAEFVSKDKIRNMLKEKQYEEIISYLHDKQNSQKLSKTEELLLQLINVYKEISDTKKMPVITSINSHTTFAAIDNHDYKKALELARIQGYGSKNEDNLLCIMLNAICDLIDKLKNEQKQEPTESVNQLHNENISFTNILLYLMSNNFGNAYKCLSDYLKMIKKTEYEFLIVDLIKISVLENDILFTKPMTILSYIERDQYVFDLSAFIQDFYITLNENRFEIARIYLDIISNATKLGYVSSLNDILYQTLNNAIDTINKKKSKTEIKKEEENIPILEEKTTTIVQEIKLEEPRKKETKIQEIKHEEFIRETPEKAYTPKEPPRTISSLDDFIREKYIELIAKKGVILLKPMRQEKIDKILKIAKKYRTMHAFVIGSGDELQIVLKYSPYIDEFVDTKKLFYQANEAYRNGNYDECINILMLPLQRFKKPMDYIYARIGLAYLKKKDIYQAIVYLTIATKVSFETTHNYDFSELLYRLNGYSSQKTERKPYFVMDESDFNYDNQEEYYGIINFDEINTIICESNKDVDSTCEDLGLTKEQIDLVKLIYARLFYTSGDIKKGDLFLKSVETSKNKTNKVMDIYNYLKQNKLFLQYRGYDISKSLKLSLKPRK